MFICKKWLPRAYKNEGTRFKTQKEVMTGSDLINNYETKLIIIIIIMNISSWYSTVSV